MNIFHHLVMYSNCDQELARSAHPWRMHDVDGRRYPENVTMKTKDYMHSQHILKNHYVQVVVCKIKRYTYNLNDNNISENMYI